MLKKRTVLPALLITWMMTGCVAVIVGADGATGEPARPVQCGIEQVAGRDKAAIGHGIEKRLAPIE